MSAAKPPKRRCENCRYWLKADYGNGEPPTTGECVRFPPMTDFRIERHVDDVMWLYPETGKFATCGEWAKNDGKHRWRHPNG